ncbi:MAG: hypothetical protein ABW170_06300 [Candidatus Thiodiazotropha sp. L084R]
MMELKMLYKALTILLLFFLLGCQSSDSSDDASLSNSDTQPDQSVSNTFFSSSDDLGRIDITDALKQYNYIESENSDIYFVEVIDRDEMPLANMDVEYKINQNINIVELIVTDPNGNFLKSMQTSIIDLSTSEVVDSERSQPAFLPIVFRMVSRIFLRAYRLYEGVDTVSSLYSLYNLDIEIERENDTIVIEGPVSEYYSLVNSLGRFVNLPIAIKRNIKQRGNRVRVRGAADIDLQDRNSLVGYLQDIGDYILSNQETILRFVIHTYDTNEGFISIEVVSEVAENVSLDEYNLYDVSISIQGNNDFSFDAFGSAPDFKGWIYVKAGEYETLSHSNDYSINDVISHVPLVVGELITVLIIDEDVVFDDDVHRFEFIFDERQIVASNMATTVTLGFSQINSDQGDSTVTEESYGLTIDIVGKESYSYDGFGGAPDFKGTISIASEEFNILVNDNSYTNSQQFNNLIIRIGTPIAVEIVDEDVLFDDDIIDFVFNFTGDNYSVSNERVDVSMMFIQN